MRKKALVGLVIALVAALALPFVQSARAQDQDIVDLAVADGRFTTLVAAVQAADLVDTLKGEGPFTVFAPTDDAFAALPEGTVEGLLADIPALTDVLLYHVVPGEVMAADVVGLSSATTAQGSDISISVVDGSVYLNETVQVILTDIEASNGVIHVIDAVLLPPAAMPESEAPGAATPMGPMTYDPTMAYLRAAHLAADAPAVDIYIAGELSGVQGLEFPNVTDFVAVPVGTYNIGVAPAGTSAADAVIGPFNYELQPGTFYTLAAVGRLDAGSLTIQVIRERYAELAEGQARVGVFHAIPDAPAVDIRLADGTVLVEGLAFANGRSFSSGYAWLDVPAGTYDLQVVPSGATEPIVLDLSGTTLEAGKEYFVAAVGTLAEPNVTLAMVDAPIAAPAEAAAEAAMLTIAEIAAGDPNFSTLLAAVQAAGLGDALSGEGPLTVFAPTNAAFEAALAALGISAEDLLADTETLSNILLYHVVPGAVTSDAVVGLNSATTLNGADITIAVVDGAVVLNDGQATVTAVDIMASNGVIHVIDGVLLPPSE